MSTIGNRRYTNPVVLNPDGSTNRLERVPFNERIFEEGWLQDLIENNPELLPIGEIEPAFTPLVSIGREVTTVSGFIDNLFMSPQGYLTIIETKLWRNPQARREVVGQLIDYAKDVSHWTFDDLERKVRKYNAQRLKSNGGIIDSLRRIADIEEDDEQIIVDTISRNLREGRFLLLVVGEGIRESVEAMADFLQQTPQLHFTLALVELQVYKLAKNEGKPLLVIPQIVARTREIIRAVVRVEGKAIESVQVGIDTEISPETKTSPEKKLSQRVTLTEEDFFRVLSQRVEPQDVKFVHQLITDMQTWGCVIDWKQGSFVVKLPDPGESGQKLSLLVVPIDGRVYLRPELKDQLNSLGLPEQIALDYARQTCRLFENCQENLKFPGSWSRPIHLRELRERYAEFMSMVQKTIDQIRKHPFSWT